MGFGFGPALVKPAAKKVLTRASTTEPLTSGGRINVKYSESINLGIYGRADVKLPFCFIEGFC